MFGSIIHRAIFRELLRVFLLSLLAITAILMLAGIVAEATQQGLNPAQILAVIPLLLPSTLPYTIPATTLFATCIVYGRLAADNEILALRAAGINMIKVLRPGLVLGLFASIATLGLYYHVIPYTHHLMRTMFLNDVEEMLYTMLRKQNQITSPHLDYSMYVKSVQGRRLINPIFKRRDARGETSVVAYAKEAELRVDLNNRLILVRMINGEIQAASGEKSEFPDRDFDAPLPEDIGVGNYRRARDMTWDELHEFEARLQDEVDEARAAVRSAETDPDPGLSQEQRKAHLQNLRGKEQNLRMQINGILAEQQMRPALAFGCLCFVLVGCPVGIWFSKSDYLSSFITCFLPIVFVYYPLVLCGTGFVKDGRADPVLTIWAADAVMGVAGVLLFRRLQRT